MSSALPNPYESPRADLSKRNPTDLDDQNGKSGKSEIKSSMLATITFGGWAGILFGGIFGVGGSLVLGLSRGLGWNQLVLPVFENHGIISKGSTLETTILVTLLGAISGVACGLSIGPVVGAMASAGAGRYRRLAIFTAILLSAVAGGLIGVLASGFIFVSQSYAGVPWAATTIVGAVIGTLSGVIGGLQLGRRILAFREP